jgi:GNAT superfamily N-acetyltransferase
MHFFDFLPLGPEHQSLAAEYLARHRVELTAPLERSEGWLALAGKRVVGVAIGFGYPMIDGNGTWFRLHIQVDPALRGQEIAGRLLEKLEDQLRMRGKVRVLASPKAGDEASCGFLRTHGFVELPEIVHFSVRLPIQLPGPVSSAIAWREIITEFDGEDLATCQRLADMFNMAYCEMVGVAPMVAARLAAGLSAGRYRCHLCQRGAELQGFAMWFASEVGRAFLACLVVAPEHQGRGLGDALTIAVAEASVRQGFGSLETDLPPHVRGQRPLSDIHARSLAIRLGFEIRATSPCFEYRIVPT